MKTCFKCNSVKPLSDFYRHSAMNDGHLGKCKSCTKADCTNNRNNNLERIREYDRVRSKLPKKKKQLHKVSHNWKIKYPDRYAAHRAVSNAVRDRKISKMPCEICGDTYRIHGHHDDYSKPLDVRWLCAMHHRQHHRDLLIRNSDREN